MLGVPQIPSGKAVLKVHTSHLHGLFFNDVKRAHLLIVPAPFIGAVQENIIMSHPLPNTYKSETAEDPDPWFEQCLVLCCPPSVPGNFFNL